MSARPTDLTANQLADDFLKVSDQFHLGFLPTEQFHPDSKNLSQLAIDNPAAAIEIWKKIDLAALHVLHTKKQELAELASALESTLKKGNRIFIYGCGATGRLALTLEHCWRTMRPESADSVLGFMSGGDLALVHSIENFEDHPEFGARQVREIGFKEGDLFLAVTEGGETPSVIGALLEAQKMSKQKHFFLYCNPPKLLQEKLQRSARVLEDKNIRSISFEIGPMALAGSTRLQATTVQLTAIGSALFQLDPTQLIDFAGALDWSFLTEFVKEESRIYKNKDSLLYRTDSLAISILTDTTERAPTFSLGGFENRQEPGKPCSWSYLCIPSAKNAQDSWMKILLRKPISLEWENMAAIAGEKRLYGFDFSAEAEAFRQQKIQPHQQFHFDIFLQKQNLTFKLNENFKELPLGNLPYFYVHLILKLLLNVHSTLVMGRLGRFEGNIMTWVRPSNYKLIDRAARYVQYLLEHHGVPSPKYEQIVRDIFRETPTLTAEEPIVLRVSKAYLPKAKTV